jgi:hypothetical protein
MTLRTVVLLTAIAALRTAAFAQNSTPTCNAATPAVCGGAMPVSDVEIKPQAVPTSTTSVSTSDAWLKTITVTNTTSGSLTFTVADRQASPIAVLSAVSIAGNTSYVIVFPMLYWCPFGFTVVASSNGLNYFASWKQ